MTYGMQLPIQSQSTLYTEPWEAAATPADLLEIARTADRSGFAYLASCDHVAIPRRLAPAMSTVWYDPVATLAHLAAVTERVRLLSHVAVVGLRHPLLTAKQYATLDHLSGGRLILGVGAGHVQEEFEALGVDFERRGTVLDETIDALARSPRAGRIPGAPRKVVRLRGARPASTARPGARTPLGRRVVPRRRTPGRPQGRRLAAAG